MGSLSIALRLLNGAAAAQSGKQRLLICTGVWNSIRRAGSTSPQNPNAAKQPLKKPKTPQGRLDEAEQSNMEKEPLQRFPGDVNPVTKEKGGPRGPEPTRYGDWERKGRCIDF
ncbi:succinate dehydrogenase assembly factor 4, mitochondrial [Spea bombifrons]|uniref:succinate dehydrogenase assembly factor 4, mitochondrial n=1 Tax=Spea bombifrons TaxID=233779 RepID=UPI00234B860F|nr:succinate dehydrogenase assembly factor 4, mitochondrial [Spea bombifrons]